jgi:DNA mismatch repair ATPase MutL
VKFNFVSVDGSRTSTILTTQGSAKVRDNFCTVFSAKQAEMLADFFCSGSDWRVIGLMSKPVPNAGMASAERQFLFLNDRPIDFPKITRVCNEMYRRVSHSHPVFVLNIVTPAHNVDVNLTPDKRTVLLHNESEIVSTMQATLKVMFEPTVQVFQVQTNTLDAFSTKTSKASSCSSATAAQSGDTGVEEVTSTSATSCSMAVREDVIELASSSPCDYIVEPNNSDQNGISCMVSRPQAVFQASSSVMNKSFVDTNSSSQALRASISDATTLVASCGSANVSNVAAIIFSDAPVSQCHSFSDNPAVMINATPVAKVTTFDMPRQHNISAHCSDMQPSTDAAMLVDLSRKGSQALTTSMFSNFARGISQGLPSTPAFISTSEQFNFMTGSDTACKRNRSSCTDSESDDSETNPNNLENLPSSRAVRHRDPIDCFNEADDQPTHPLSASKNAPLSDQAKENHEQDYLDDQAENNVVSDKASELMNPLHTIPAISVSVDWTKLMQQVSSGLGPMNSSGWKMWGASNADPSISQSSGGECLNSDQFKNCSNGLSHGTILTDRKIDKADFTRMEVLGQFNKGFIISRLLDDMYIIDQHASDEKCRFEMLQRNTVLRTQPLIAPLPLDLSPGDEEILEQRAAIFAKSGFNFRYDDSERPGRRARLMTVPFSHNVQLGPADVQEMLFLLKDNVCQLCRPSRITSMFASRACRSAIMIGDSLPLPQMRKVCLSQHAQTFSSLKFFADLAPAFKAGPTLELPTRSSYNASFVCKILEFKISNCNS